MAIGGEWIMALFGPGFDAGGRVFLSLVLMILPVTSLGIAFPYLMQSVSDINQLPARRVGVLYAVNSIGSAAGAVLGGYFLPRTIGTIWGFALTSVLLSLLSAACLSKGRPARQRLAHPLLPPALVCLLLLVIPKDLHFYSTKETLVESAEDEYGIQIVTRTREGMLKIKNNRIFIAYHLGSNSTSAAQEMISYYSCLLADSCDRVMNIGTGYGITAGAFTLFDQVKSIRTVELLPFIFNSQEKFGDFNFRYFEDSRVERLCGDGRQRLGMEDELYDIISVNVLDPYTPGSSGLMTVDFWREARNRLKPNGVYSQLIWGPDATLLIRGMKKVFPVVLIFNSAYWGAFNVVAFNNPDSSLEMKLDRLTDRAKFNLQKFDIRDTRRFFPEQLAEATARSNSFDRYFDAPLDENTLHSDSYPILEYRWSHGVGAASSFDSLQAIEYE
jgi:spermidine synthase